MRALAAYVFALVLLVPIGLALLGANLALIILGALAWPLERLRDRCLKYLHALNRAVARP